MLNGPVGLDVVSISVFLVGPVVCSWLTVLIAVNRVVFSFLMKQLWCMCLVLLVVSSMWQILEKLLGILLVRIDLWAIMLQCLSRTLVAASSVLAWLMVLVGRSD